MFQASVWLRVESVVRLVPRHTFKDWMVIVGLWVAIVCAFALGSVSDARWTFAVPGFAFVAFACVVQWPLKLRYWVSVTVWSALLAVYWAGLATTGLLLLVFAAWSLGFLFAIGLHEGWRST